MSNTYPNHNRLKRFVSVVALGCVALTGCKTIGNTGGNQASDSKSATISAGSVNNGTNVRESPAIEFNAASGDTNICAEANDATIFVAGPIEIAADSANGDWIGFDRSQLPEDIQNACEGDADNKLWISEQYVSGQITR